MKTMTKKQYRLLSLFFSVLGFAAILFSVLPELDLLYGIGCVLTLFALPLWGYGSTFEYYE